MKGVKGVKSVRQSFYPNPLAVRILFRKFAGDIKQKKV